MSSVISTHSTPDNLFSVSRSKVTGFFSMREEHVHEQYEIYYLVSGQRYYFVKDRIFHIRKGHLVFVRPGEMHKTTDTDVPDHQRKLIYFRREFLETSNGSVAKLLFELAQKGYCVMALSTKEQRIVEKICDEIFEEMASCLDGYEAAVQGLLLKLLVFIARYSGQMDGSGYLSDQPRHEKIADVVRYINAHYQEPLPVGDIARLFFISPYYLCRTFKETTGYTIVHYINSVRVKQAQKLLCLNELKVTDVMEKSGFGSISQFNRVFREVTGCSPLNYRKTTRSD